MIDDELTPPESVAYFLVWLDRMSVDEIAAYLSEDDAYAGIRGSCEECPLANFLFFAGGAEAEVSIGYREGAGQAVVYWGGGRVELALPTNLVDFAKRFDAGDFPALEYGRA